MLKNLRPLPVLILAIAMFIFPQEVLSSASAGLKLWWQYVLPALLPFFILSELLMGMGFVSFLGVLLEPLMRPLFNLPGKAAFVVAMGYTSGFPMGAVLTARLRHDGDITREEGERLLTFTNNPSPGFMFGAVASGLLGKPGLGVILAASVYISNLIVGVFFRFYGPQLRHSENSKVSLRRAWESMLNTQAKDGRPIGSILGQAIRQSITTVLAVGGYIVFFAVVLKLLTLWKITYLLTSLLSPVLSFFLPFSSIKAVLDGLLEMTLGCQEIVQNFTLLNAQVAGLAFVMGWGGVSVFAQIAGFIADTDLRFFPYALARIFHAFLALGLSQLLLRLAKVPAAVVVSMPAGTPEIWLNSWQLSSRLLIGILVGFLILTFLQRMWSLKRY